MHSRQLLFFLFLAAIVFISFFSLHCSSSPEQQEKKEADFLYLNHHDSVKYVGIETCRSCHAEIYNSFIQTGMGQSFNVASRKKSAADFTRRHVVYDSAADYYYTAYWQGEQMMMMEFRLQGKDTIHKRVEQVSYIIGSGQHTNSHIMNRNGYLYQMPMTWYAQQKKWDLPPGFENGRNSRFNRIIGEECMSCHNALPAFVNHSENRFNTVPAGIDCERCHGPGQVHVSRKLAGLHADTSQGKIDYSIVNPRKLPWHLQIDVCQRCHLQGNSVLKPGKSFRDFKPGMKLGDFWNVYMPRYAGNDQEFIMASHADRLQQSPCFVRSNREGRLQLTCITCHNPHVSVKHTGREVFNNACRNCHASANDACSLPEQQRLSKNNNNCVACHMPSSGTIDIPHVTVHDHYIRKPVQPGKKEEIKKYIGIACVNNKTQDEMSMMEAFISYYEKFEGPISSLDSAFNRINTSSLNETSARALVHIYYLKNQAAEVISLAAKYPGLLQNDAWTQYRIGQSYLNTGRYPEGLACLQKANELAPDNLAFMNKLAECYIQNKEPEQAGILLDKLLLLNPAYTAALNNRGFAYLLMNNIPEANKYYEKALRLDPDDEPALMNKAALLNLLGEKDKARRILQRVLKKNPAQQQALQLIKTLQ